MDFRELVKLITTEVLKQLNGPVEKEVLVLVTGGRAVWPKVRFKLEEMSERGFKLNPILSEAAYKMFDLQELEKIFGSVKQLPNKEMMTVVKSASLILLPTLTANTAAKLANGIQDTQVTVCTSWALRFGKPVMAVSNSADPNSSEFKNLGLSIGSEEYKSQLANNLKKLTSFGMKLVEADYLLPDAMQILDCDPISKEMPVKIEGVLTREKVQAVVGDNSKIIISKGGTVTPLAKESAEKAGIKICYE